MIDEEASIVSLKVGILEGEEDMMNKNHRYWIDEAVTNLSKIT